jgi:hypothetical protein
MLLCKSSIEQLKGLLQHEQHDATLLLGLMLLSKSLIRLKGADHVNSKRQTLLVHWDDIDSSK